jgi:hypothetical protein
VLELVEELNDVLELVDDDVELVEELVLFELEDCVEALELLLELYCSLDELEVLELVEELVELLELVEELVELLELY